MRRSILAAIIWIFINSATAFAEFNPYGKWYFEGGGFAEKLFVRVELNAWGELHIRTTLESGDRYLTGYDIDATIDATRFDINAWEYSTDTTLEYPVPVPEVNPTLNNPFKLPKVTYEGLTYEVELTSAASGIVKIYGYLSGGIEVDSKSALWKSGTKKPDIPDMTSGCDAFCGAASLLLAALVLARAFKK